MWLEDRISDEYSSRVRNYVSVVVKTIVVVMDAVVEGINVRSQQRVELRKGLELNTLAEGITLGFNTSSINLISTRD